MTSTPDALVLGAGVIGLSIALELADCGLRVTVLERGEPGREASWAGAGVIPPASWYESHPALDALAMAAVPMHARLSERLREEAALDDGYWPCGAEYRRTPENAAYLDAALSRWRGLRIVAEELPSGATLVPAEAQVRNPRRLKGLANACERRGVRIVAGAEVRRVRRAGDRIVSVEAAGGEFSAGAVCFAAGCWTPALAEGAASAAPGRPIRGEVILLSPSAVRLERIVHRYPYYAVPRRDGRVLVGATVEDAGFDKQTTPRGLADLQSAAVAIDPRFAGATVEAHWAGLRPASADALPQIGPLPGVANAWVAAGHHRSGLQLAPPTAAIVAALVAGRPSPHPAAAFDPARFSPGRSGGVR